MENKRTELEIFNELNSYLGRLSKNRTDYIWEIRKGKKFAKVTHAYTIGSSSSNWSVFCFIDLKNGDIYKAASWAQPAKGVRGNIFDENPPLTLSSLYKRK